MAKLLINLKELLKIIVKNNEVPEIIKGIYVNGRTVSIVVKPNSILPEIKANFDLYVVEDNKLNVLFEKSKAQMIYMALKAGSNVDKVDGLRLTNEGILVDFNTIIKDKVNGAEIQQISIDDNGDIEMELKVL
ncbi:hypothetical protein ACAG39_04330 [Caldicellulosiruptoraceae bacterium PP1]